MADPGTPLCSVSQFSEGAFADLVTGYTQQALQDIMLEATRMCEDETGRRLAPFTVTETHRAEGVDPDEYPGTANIPMSIQGTLGNSYANAIGAGNDLVRHCWLDQKASKYPDMWAYSNVTVQIIRSYGGTQQLQPTQILNGPENDTGHIWFQLGLFAPINSRFQIAYSGGYTIAIPASLVRANKYMAASIIVRELNPDDTRHDPEVLYSNAAAILANWIKDD